MIFKVLIVPLAAVISLLFLYLLLTSAPHENEKISFPSNLEDIKVASSVLNKYNENHKNYVLLLFSSAYLFKQTFAVPGSVFLNILAGSIFGLLPGFILCSFLTAFGASLCYLLARAVGKDAAKHFFPERVELFKLKLEENKRELPFFLLFLRLFPMSPNWALNMTSGVLGVPLHLFFLSVLFGLMPYNYLCVTSGVLLSELTEVGDILSWSNMAKCASLALVAILPTIIMKTKRRSKESLD